MLPDTSAQITLEWGDGEYLFALKGKQIENIEKVTGDDFGKVAMRLFSRVPKYADIRETVFQGLIGGGMPVVTASQKMAAYFEGQPIDATNDPSSPLKTAIAVMQAAWFGVPELTKKGEARAGESPAPSSPDTAHPS